MANIEQQIAAMLELQHRMNSKVHPQWFEQGFAYYRALWIECGELMEHHGYKWWKKQEPDLEQVRLEIVDIWHFGLSMRIDGRPLAEIAREMTAELEAQYSDSHLSILQATEALAADTLNRREFSVVHFWALLEAAAMSPDDLYSAYVGKNVLNFFRQDNGYKEGSYMKLWAGREDNEHLVEISQALDPSASDYEHLLYQSLQERYQALSL